ncbi:MAG TPA: DUF1634 domain-containing protein [Thermomicrobiales bacterium]|nr:DUF1634 domain-containing protein [Thermomicrobiales bacterium]
MIEPPLAPTETPIAASIEPLPPLAQRNQELAPLYDAVRLLLTWGFRLGAALLVIGIVLAVIQRQPLNAAVDPFGQIVPNILAGHAAGVIDLAIVWLIAIPALAVLVTAVGFFQAQDWRYAVASILVLALLVVSMVITARLASLIAIIVISLVGIALVLSRPADGAKRNGT